MYLVFNVFYFYSGVGQKDSGVGRAHLAPPFATPLPLSLYPLQILVNVSYHHSSLFFATVFISVQFKPISSCSLVTLRLQLLKGLSLLLFLIDWCLSYNVLISLSQCMSNPVPFPSFYYGLYWFLLCFVPQFDVANFVWPVYL
jgi:hypothetical protein